MAQRFQKIYTTLELEEAHVIQALMRRNGVACWLLRSNGLRIEKDSPLAENGYKLFLPEFQFKQGLAVFQNTFGVTDDPPYVGSLDLAFGGRSQSVPLTQIGGDPVGPEEFVWSPPVGDPVGDAWKEGSPDDTPGSEVAPKAPEVPTCAKCGQEMPAGVSQCFRCGEFR